MDSGELHCLISQNSIVSSRYTGEIYCYDTLPKQLLKGKFYIVNDKSSTSDYSIPGHWLTLCHFENFFLYVDSFGLPVESQFVFPLLEKCNSDIYYMNYCLQNIEASSCALHALVWATCFSFNWTVSDILVNCYDIFNSESKSNPYFFDQIAQKFVSDFYNESRSIFYEF